MEPIEPITGKPLRFPPGRVEIKLDQRHRSAYRALYARYQSYNAGLPILRERDFDGRAVKVTREELAALNAAFATVAAVAAPGGSAFGTQEATKTELYKRTQYLS